MERVRPRLRAVVVRDVEHVAFGTSRRDRPEGSAGDRLGIDPLRLLTPVVLGQPSLRFDGEIQETIQFRGSDYTTIRRGINVGESDLIPIGTAILTHTGVVDPSVWALPGVDPAKLIIVRTPPGFDEPGWNVSEFVYFTRKDVVGAILEACPYFADPTPGCLNMYPSPAPR